VKLSEFDGAVTTEHDHIITSINTLRRELPIRNVMKYAVAFAMSLFFLNRYQVHQWLHVRVKRENVTLVHR